MLLGHRGCGKSTELNRLAESLEQENYKVKTIFCSHLDLINLAYADLFIMMGEALLQIAQECHCEICDEILEKIKTFWYKGSKTKTKTILESEGGELEAGTSAETPGILKGVLSIFAKIKGHLKYNEETRVEFREEIRIYSTEWIRLLESVSNEILRCGKKPFIIFEDLDKLEERDAWEVFHNNELKLSGMSFPVVYTFPIALSYDPKFSALQARFVIKTLPMIKIETKEGKPFEEGVKIIEKLVEKRANLALFEEDVLDRLIKATGGILRHLFEAIITSGTRARRRRSNTISMEDANRALTELKTSLTRQIDQNYYEFLAQIYRGNRQKIEDKEKLLKMLQAMVVLEYNGERWHNVHPLVTEFLVDQGLV